MNQLKNMKNYSDKIKAFNALIKPELMAFILNKNIAKINNYRYLNCYLKPVDYIKINTLYKMINHLHKLKINSRVNKKAYRLIMDLINLAFILNTESDSGAGKALKNDLKELSKILKSILDKINKTEQKENNKE